MKFRLLISLTQSLSSFSEKDGTSLLFHLLSSPHPFIPVFLHTSFGSTPVLVLIMPSAPLKFLHQSKCSWFPDFRLGWFLAGFFLNGSSLCSCVNIATARSFSSSQRGVLAEALAVGEVAPPPAHSGVPPPAPSRNITVQASQDSFHPLNLSTRVSPVQSHE